MREPKPFWRDVPLELCDKIEEKVGSSILKANRVSGGYGPSATFRIFLKDGRTVFAKGAGPGSSEVNWRVLPHEEFVYRHIDAISSVSPSYLGSVSVDGWHLILIEDLRNAKKVPPWTETLALQAIRDITAFHLRGLTEVDKVENMHSKGISDNWLNLKNSSDDRECFLRLFQDNRNQAEDWLNDVNDKLISVEAELLRLDQPWGIIHTDIRSDNLRFRGGSLVLFDWALLCSGPLIVDVGFLFPSIEGEGGPVAETLLYEYKKVMAANGIDFPLYSEQAVAVATAGVYALRAGKPPIPQHPRLRHLQCLQLGPALRWASSALGLPQPPKLRFNG